MNNGFIYQVKESNIFVRNRPKSLEIDSEILLNEDRADAYLSVTDTFVSPPEDKPFVWFPWNEGRSPIPEMYYATNKVLNWWVLYKNLKTIHVFCDGGTHRSVTVFGAFLRTYFSNDEAKKIVSERKAVGINENKDNDGWANPLEYIDSYLEKFPEDNLLFKAMNENRLGRLDDHCKNIYALIKDRFGDNYNE